MALGVAFGLGMSLLLKHSSLNLYPSIESCLVALCAYTCYFFSNGLSMSGIVSLLFCGITLKHYAYHTMSRRTQRASKSLFSTLAQLSENFIFIYLGMSLFTSAPTSEAVTSYVKPLFIVITTVAVIFTRYAAVFPLSELINFFHKHARGQRTEELPHSYQMMLFWAGLRGAVGVALAAGFKGDNAQIMRTTVLVVVVLTVCMFGGTTARMLEVLGIRTGVEDDAASESDNDDTAMGGAVWVGRGNGLGRWARFIDDESSAIPPYGRGDGRIGTHYDYPSRTYNHHSQFRSPVDNPNTQAIFSAASSDSFDSDAEVLPMAPTALETGTSHTGHPPRQGSGSSGIGEEGKWFQTLDERYLLPLFSNATASRTFHARRARRTASGPLGGNAGSANGSRGGTPADSEDEVDLGSQEIEVPSRHRSVGSVDESRMERGLASPALRNPAMIGDNRLPS